MDAEVAEVSRERACAIGASSQSKWVNTLELSLGKHREGYAETQNSAGGVVLSK